MFGVRLRSCRRQPDRQLGNGIPERDSLAILESVSALEGRNTSAETLPAQLRNATHASFSHRRTIARAVCVATTSRIRRSPHAPPPMAVAIDNAMNVGRVPVRHKQSNVRLRPFASAMQPSAPDGCGRRWQRIGPHQSGASRRTVIRARSGRANAAAAVCLALGSRPLADVVSRSVVAKNLATPCRPCEG
jgi:hypothetical protein